MYNVKAAVSRLEFGADVKTMEVTDIRTGHFVFAPLADRPVSFEKLESAIEKAGYEVEKVTLTVGGVLGSRRRLELPGGQVFQLTVDSDELRSRMDLAAPGERLRLRGAWKTANATEMLTVSEILPGGR